MLLGMVPERLAWPGLRQEDSSGCDRHMIWVMGPHQRHISSSSLNNTRSRGGIGGFSQPTSEEDTDLDPFINSNRNTGGYGRHMRGGVGTAFGSFVLLFSFLGPALSSSSSSRSSSSGGRASPAFVVLPCARTYALVLARNIIEPRGTHDLKVDSLHTYTVAAVPSASSAVHIMSASAAGGAAPPAPSPSSSAPEAARALEFLRVVGRLKVIR